MCRVVAGWAHRQFTCHVVIGLGVGFFVARRVGAKICVPRRSRVSAAGQVWKGSGTRLGNVQCKLTWTCSRYHDVEVEENLICRGNWTRTMISNHISNPTIYHSISYSLTTSGHPFRLTGSISRLRTRGAVARCFIGYRWLRLLFYRSHGVL